MDQFRLPLLEISPIVVSGFFATLLLLLVVVVRRSPTSIRIQHGVAALIKNRHRRRRSRRRSAPKSPPPPPPLSPLLLRPLLPLPSQPPLQLLINMKTRHDRLVITLPRLKRLGFNITRLDAVAFLPELTKLVDTAHLEPVRRNWRTKHSDLSKGAIGCYLSHVLCWNKILNHDSEFGIVFEDDVLPPSDTTYQDIIHLIQNAPPDWDMLLLGCINLNHTIIKAYQPIKEFMLMHAYVLRKSIIPTLLANCFPMQYQVDFLMCNLSMVNILKIYRLGQLNWTQNNRINSTNIQTPLFLSESSSAPNLSNLISLKDFSVN